MSENADHELKETLAKIEARKVAFDKDPLMFTIWDTLNTILNVWLCVAFLFRVTNCTCNGCAMQVFK